MANDTGRTEKPTPRRLRKARKEGQFPRTPDAATWLAIAAGATMVPHSARATASYCRTLLDRLPEVANDPTPSRALGALGRLPVDILLATAPVGLAAAGGALLATMAQGVHVSGSVLAPKFSRLSPRQGLRRMLGTRSLWEAAKALAKVAVVAGVVGVLGERLIPGLIGSGGLPLGATIDRTRSALEKTVWAAAVAGLLLALADYSYQRRTVMKQLRMSPREIKDELRQTEGDPLVKGAIRARQMAISRNRMLSAVAGADVVLVNPTHLAVALKYEAGRGAPRVIAKGAGTIAAKIRERARENRVPVVEDKPLARILYRVCELGEEIPAELYLAVARILAFVMTAGRPSRFAPTRRPPSATTVPVLPSRAHLRARRAREVRASRRP